MNYKIKKIVGRLVTLNDFLFELWMEQEDNTTLINFFYISAYQPDSVYSYTLVNVLEPDYGTPWLVDEDEFTYYEIPLTS